MANTLRPGRVDRTDTILPIPTAGLPDPTRAATVRVPVTAGTAWARLPPTGRPLRGRTRVIRTGGRAGTSTAPGRATRRSRGIRRGRVARRPALRSAPRDRAAHIRISIM